jgi:hypothetical protein
MAWAKFDDRYDDHRKVILAVERSPLAGVLHAHGITYSARHETDGYVDAVFLTRYRGIRSAREVDQAVTVLVDGGLWHPDGDGWRVHDYLDFNPSHESLATRRAKDAARKAAKLAAGRAAEAAQTPRGVVEESAPEQSGASRGQALPVPALPVPTLSPPAPHGGRERDRAEWWGEYTAWAERHFPGVDARHVRWAQDRLAAVDRESHDAIRRGLERRLGPAPREDEAA